jgi:hypothetical protein
MVVVVVAPLPQQAQVRGLPQAPHHSYCRRYRPLPPRHHRLGRKEALLERAQVAAGEPPPQPAQAPPLQPQAQVPAQEPVRAPPLLRQELLLQAPAQAGSVARPAKRHSRRRKPRQARPQHHKLGKWVFLRPHSGQALRTRSGQALRPRSGQALRTRPRQALFRRPVPRPAQPLQQLPLPVAQARHPA